MDQVLISVIIPIYKAEEFLKACLDSVLAQTFTNFELLLIDDASPDNSALICDEYAAKDNRVKVFHEKFNGGTSVARNIGLDNAKGKYIVFIDSDDRVLVNHFQSLLYTSLIPDGTLVSAPVLREINGKLTNDNHSEPYFIDNLINSKIITDDIFAGAPWAKLLELKIINLNNIRFRTEVKINEDHVFHLEYLLHVCAYKNVGKRTYVYISRIGDSLSKKYMRESFDSYRLSLNYMVPYTIKVIKRFEIQNDKLINQIYVNPSRQIIYSIFSLYKSFHRKDRINRIRSIKVLMVDYRFILLNYYKPISAVDKCIRSVLLLKNYFLMDMILSFVVWVRYSVGYKSYTNK